MLNHARTLLLNEAAQGRPELGENGEEYVPPEFTPQTLEGGVSKIRDLFLGTGNDPLYQNFRLAQIMLILHDNDVSREIILAMDPRYTYRVRSSGFNEYGWGSSVAALNPKGMTLETLKDGVADDRLGRMAFNWRVKTESGTLLRVTRGWSGDSNLFELDFDGEYSQPIELDNELNIRLIVPPGSWDENAFWEVTSYARTGRDLGELLVRADKVGAQAVNQTFLSAPDSLYNLWSQGVSLADRLAGLLGAAIHQMNEQYNAS